MKARLYIDYWIRENSLMAKFLKFCVVIALITANGFSQTSGKIAGKVIDKNTGQPLHGANVIIENTDLGAACDEDGEYFIINIYPGFYTVRFEMMGYEIIRIEEVRISVNRTYPLDASLEVMAVQGDVVTVTADKLSIKKDQTSSSRNISSKNIEILPVEDVNDVIELQAGVVKGHFRGGRSDEVSYLIDGIAVDEVYKRKGQSVNVEVEVVEELEVITGTFNAEYGKAMSGIVNIVTKDGMAGWHGTLRANNEYFLTSHTDHFISNNLQKDIGFRDEYNISLRGPIIANKISIVVNGRYEDKDGPYFGFNRFEVDNYSDYTSVDSTQWYSEHTGSGKKVLMNSGQNYSLFGKLTVKPMPTLKLAITQTLENRSGYNYSHYYKYNPDGRPGDFSVSQLSALQVNHTISRRAFQDIKVSYADRYSGHYVYKDPNDSRYVSPNYSRSVAGFSSGGNSKTHTERWTNSINVGYSLHWQVHKNHSIKTGLEYYKYDIDSRESQIQNKWAGTQEEYTSVYDTELQRTIYPYYEPIIRPDSSIYSDIYTAAPVEFAGYIQDKMEFDLMVINMGLRYDYSNPNTVYPSQLRNPANQLYFPKVDEDGNVETDSSGNVVLNMERMSTYPTAKPREQISPRLGIAYQLGEKALLRFSYGHFFQMPAYYAIYENHSFLVSPTDYATTMGNPNIKAQKIVQYEVGFWQQLNRRMTMEVAIYYRDIYDLLGAKVITTYNQIHYGLYSNKDYGNARGFELKYEFSNDPIQIGLNYTLQYTKGNADNPTSTFNREGSQQDPIKRLIPMSWDQRHTLNMSVGYNMPQYGITLLGYYESGTPYTWEPIAISALSTVNLYPNNSVKPSTYKVDINGYINLLNKKQTELRLTFRIYNLLDRLNAENVYSSTGSPSSTIVQEAERYLLQSDFIDYDTAILVPTYYQHPRMVKMGLEFNWK
jgi:outer membrane receptor for ferrienterochelin and colicin